MEKCLRKLANRVKDITSSYIQTAAKEMISVTNAFAESIEIMEHENALAVAGNYDVVFALRPVAKELSQLTGNTYVNYLDRAKEMLLEGKDIPEVLCYFDVMLHELKEPCDKCNVRRT